MRINNNISAMNTYSRLTSAQGAQSKSLEKLSSGLRINRAGDDAAGLAISEKMRGQIKGLNQSVRNAQDGISLIQTAEGALNETHSILNRMRELAVQSANDTNTNSDRNEIQKEMDQLSIEITRIADNTEFNTQNLLNGDLTAKFHIGANKGQNMTLQIGSMTSESLSVNGKAYEAQDVTGTGLSITSRDGKAVKIAYANLAAAAVTDAVEESATYDKDTNTITVTLGQNSSDASTVGTINTTNSRLKSLIEDAASKGDEVFSVSVKTAGTENTALTVKPADFTSALWTEDVSISAPKLGINVSTQGAADEAIKVIDNAITSVSAERSKLGAFQNRLDHTINNLTTTSENLAAAESRIRDVDMAKEMMEFTKNNILNQASTAMLAQANQMPQGVLQLLG
ncbi:flagellin [Proteiniclasticum sp.]|uniref:flagellin N-terminal helical domain-containing protein n=1 Tax=Proteiniclasticum sp. TaxID=2053595 RepID=UPI002897D5D4|nr:flagellin [Proteiniclasticum sp.]